MFSKSDLVYFPASCPSLVSKERVSNYSYIRDKQEYLFPYIYGQQLMYKSKKDSPLDFKLV